MRLRRALGILMLGIGGLFGIRTPPEPTVVAQMQPAKPPGGNGRAQPPDEDREAPRIVNAGQSGSSRGVSGEPR
jgi:hypothetical protein